MSPCLNDAPVAVALLCWKRQEDRKNKKYGLELQRHEIAIICVVECQHLPLNRRATAARRWLKCSIEPSANVPPRWWGHSCVYGDEKPREW